MQHAVHVDTGHTPVQCLQSKFFHRGAPVVEVPGGAPGDHRFRRVKKKRPPEGWKTPRIVADSGLFTVRAAPRRTEVRQAARQLGVRASPVQVRLGIGVGPSIVLRPHSPCPPPRIMHQRAQAFMCGGDAAAS